MHNLHTYCNLYCACVITSGRTWEAAAAEGDSIGEQQLKQTIGE